VDIEKLRTQIAAPQTPACGGRWVKADDPRELCRCIAELERQLRAGAPAPKVEKVVERVCS
jgi:hypothetical protein